MYACKHIECAHLGTRAVWYPIVCFGPRGYAVTPDTTAQIMIPLYLCETHKSSFDGKEFISLNEGKLLAYFKSIGRVDPDFENAWVEFKAITPGGQA